MSCDFEINILHRWRGIGGPRDGVMLLFLRHRAAKGSKYHIVGSSNSFLSLSRLEQCTSLEKQRYRDIM